MADDTVADYVKTLREFLGHVTKTHMAHVPTATAQAPADYVTVRWVLVAPFLISFLSYKMAKGVSPACQAKSIRFDDPPYAPHLPLPCHPIGNTHSPHPTL